MSIPLNTYYPLLLIVEHCVDHGLDNVAIAVMDELMEMNVPVESVPFLHHQNYFVAVVSALRQERPKFDTAARAFPRAVPPTLSFFSIPSLENALHFLRVHAVLEAFRENQEVTPLMEEFFRDQAADPIERACVMEQKTESAECLARYRQRKQDVLNLLRKALGDAEAMKKVDNEFPIERLDDVVRTALEALRKTFPKSILEGFTKDLVAGRWKASRKADQLFPKEVVYEEPFTRAEIEDAFLSNWSQNQWQEIVQQSHPLIQEFLRKRVAALLDVFHSPSSPDGRENGRAMTTQDVLEKLTGLKEAAQHLKNAGADPLEDIVKGNGHSKHLDSDGSEVAPLRPLDDPEPVPRVYRPQALKEKDLGGSLNDPGMPSPQDNSGQKGRRRVSRKWTQEEVTSLVEGVRLYGAGHWKQIWKSYRFDGRTPVDLKDKWRNILRSQGEDGKLHGPGGEGRRGRRRTHGPEESAGGIPVETSLFPQEDDDDKELPKNDDDNDDAPPLKKPRGVDLGDDDDRSGDKPQTQQP